MKLINNFIQIVLLICCASCTKEIDPLSDEFIEKINQKQSLWKAGRNFHSGVSIDEIKSLLGVISAKKLPYIPERVYPNVTVPDSFDSREVWSNCLSIGHIRDQSNCGSCWAVAATEAMTDRLCIHSGGEIQTYVSAADLLACCSDCGHGCYGGVPSSAWEYWVEHGIASGGDFNSSQGCKPYLFPPCQHNAYTGSLPKCGPYRPTPKCTKTCYGNPSLSYKDDLILGKEVYIIRNEHNIQAEIFLNGPVEAVIVVYEDFPHYKSGIYKHVEGKIMGGHAVKIIGWGVEDSIPYWLIVNSWNEYWGMNGTFKMLRGSNECGVEYETVAGLPKL